ncbi:MAG: tetratricopeptide repeat protein [Myxococcota bacterium]
MNVQSRWRGSRRAPADPESGPRFEFGSASPPIELPSTRALRAAPKMSVGQTIGRYIVLDTLGRGGMGVVARAYDPRLQREVAIKKLLVERGSQADAQLVREAQAMARLSHPNVVPVYDVASDGQSVFLTMEFVSGTNLSVWLHSAPRSWREVVDVFVDAGRGLAAAHELHLVHRDFKPSNVLIGDDGRVRVADFGLARVPKIDTPDTPESTDDFVLTSSSMTTAHGVLMGTPYYMPPEQHDNAHTDARGDQYSFCVSLWEALCRARPFHGSPDELLERKLGGPPRWPTDVDVPSWLVELLRRGLEPDPRRRWPSMRAMLEVLERRAHRRRRRWWLGLGGGLLVLGVLGGIYRGGHEPGCTNGRAQLDDVWGESQRHKVQHRMSTSARAYARALAPTVVQGLDDYAEAWGRVHDRACRARAQPGYSERAGDRQLVCLDRRRAALDAAVGLLADPRADVVDRAVTMVQELPTLERCEDLAGLLSAVAPPDDPRVAERVEEIRQTLAEVRSLHAAGLFEQAERTLTGLAQAARASDYAPVIAEIGYEQAQLQLVAGHYQEAFATLRRAYATAVGVGHDPLAARAASSLLFVSAQRLGEYDVALAWADSAVALAERGDPGGALPATVQGYYSQLLALRGEHAQAEEQQREVLRTVIRTSGERSLAVASAKHQLAFVLAVGGRRDQALPLIEQVVAITSDVLGPEHPRTTGARAQLANALRLAGQWRRAQQMFGDVLALQRRTLRPQHPALAFTLVNLASVELMVGQLDQALERGQEAIAINEVNLGPEHPDLATALITTGSVMLEAGDYEGAKLAFERAVTIRTRSFGPDHVSVALARSELAVAQWRRGRYEEAESLFEVAVAGAERSLGPEHPDVVLMVHNFGGLLLDRGHAAEAAPMFERAARTWEATRGADDFDVTMAMSNLGFALESQGRYDEAAEVLARVLSTRERTLGPEHPRTASTLATLGDVRRGQGQLQAAAQHHARALEIRERARGPAHPEVAFSLAGLASVYQARGELGSAEALLRRALSIHEQASGPRSVVRAQGMAELGQLLGARGKLDEARPLLEQALRVMQSESAPAVALAEARFALARVLAAAGEPRARARALAAEARDGFGGAGPGQATRRLEVERWIHKHDRGRPGG